jgi:WD40 repeat protein
MRSHGLHIWNRVWCQETAVLSEGRGSIFLLCGMRLFLMSALILGCCHGVGQTPPSSAAGNASADGRTSEAWQPRLEGTQVRGGLAWSPDGSALVFLGVPRDPPDELSRSEGYPYILKIREETFRRIPLVVDLGQRPRFSPAGSKLALCIKDPKDSEFLAILNTETGSLDTIVEYPGWKTDVSWSPDGRKIAFTKVAEFEELTDLLVFDIETGAVTVLRDNDVGTGQAVKRASWVPQSSRIAFIEGYAYGTVTAGGILYTIGSNDTGLRTLVEPGDEEEIARFQYSSDGDLVAHELVRWDEGRNHCESEVWVCDGSGGKRRKLLGPDFHLVQFSPDGRYVLCDSEELRGVISKVPTKKHPALEFAEGEEEIFFVDVDTGERTPVRSIWTDAAWSPEGKMLAVVHGGRLRLVESPR